MKPVALCLLLLSARLASAPEARWAQRTQQADQLDQQGQLNQAIPVEIEAVKVAAATRHCVLYPASCSLYPAVMRAPIFQVDAFTAQRFAGNPAAIIPLPRFLPDATLQAIAAENNLAETAYLVRSNGNYHLRWFTPGTEVPLCGHATLASAAVVMERLEPSRTEVVFHSASGPLTVRKNGAGYVMDFPTRPSSPVPAPAGLAEALGAAPLEVTENDFNYLALLESENALRALAPDMAALIRIGKGGVIVTAKSDDTRYDFVSRYFAPVKGIPEDPVTGSAHCMLAPWWAKRLGKTDFTAFQASPRGGRVLCRLRGDRTELEGECVFYLEGEVEI